jgi:hypothetical protein
MTRIEMPAREYGRIIKVTSKELIVEEPDKTIPIKHRPLELWFRKDDNPSFTLIVQKNNEKWGYEFVREISRKEVERKLINE